MDIVYAARASILQLIGGVLLLDINQNKVHIMYLPYWRTSSNPEDLVGALQYWNAYTMCFVERQSRLPRPWAVATFYCNLGHYTKCYCTRNRAIVHRTHVPYDD
ncbi:hypothetical protein PVK06_016650 [Gossypium arboreum]|uniref:Uncharacterized protein n=1 Tax=Gossypium arboreum TaxID=29729 RepID=A0ABR0Q1E3_GOSAR|nr:hypothetical protein PVK06_016650 [Gossypium arboreum]